MGMKRIILGFVCVVALVHSTFCQSISKVLDVSEVGMVILIEDFKSEYVIPRNVEIFIPNDYDTGSKEKYEVLYMHDGQNVFNVKTSYTGVTWGVDLIIDSLVNAGTIDKTIIVAPWNTRAKRFSEFMPEAPSELSNSPFVKAELKKNTGFDDLYSDEYLQFIVKELKPYIDKHYNVYTEAEHTSIMGSSMGGLISLYAISKYPEIFGAAGCVSTHWPVPVLGDAYIGTLSDALPSATDHRIYFDYGTEGLDSEYEPYQLRVDSIMADKGYIKGSNWQTLKFPGDNHNEKSWSGRVDTILAFLLGK